MTATLSDATAVTMVSITVTASSLGAVVGAQVQLDLRLCQGELLTDIDGTTSDTQG